MRRTRCTRNAISRPICGVGPMLPRDSRWYMHVYKWWRLRCRLQLTSKYIEICLEYHACFVFEKWSILFIGRRGNFFCFSKSSVVVGGGCYWPQSVGYGHCTSKRACWVAESRGYFFIVRDVYFFLSFFLWDKRPTCQRQSIGGS